MTDLRTRFLVFYKPFSIFLLFRSPHRSWQYQPYRRAISPTLPRNMADIGFQYDACRDAQPVRLLIKPRVYTFQC